MKTDELPGDYEVEDSIENANAMTGVGHESPPSVILEPPGSYFTRRNGKMVEVETPAWVKFSTEFKKELKELDVYSLKVFLYIGLSVNWKTGEACPGVRLIAEETGMDKGTVVIAVENLQEMGFLDIQKRQGTSNIYKTVRYISIGTVRQDRTPENELSGENAELSGDQEGILRNKKNKNKTNLTEKDYEQAQKELYEIIGASIGPLRKAEKEAIDAFESAFSIARPWEWYPDTPRDKNRTWTDFRSFVLDLYQADRDCFTKYVTWTRVPYAKGTMTSLGIKRNPQDFPDSWSCFLASESMYGKNDDNRPHPEFEKIKAPEGVTYAPPPPKIKIPR